jgi:hypothetical protein
VSTWGVLSLCFWQESERERQGACAGEPECLRVLLLPVIMIIARFLAVCEHVRLVAVLFSKAHAFRGVCLCFFPWQPYCLALRIHACRVLCQR